MSIIAVFLLLVLNIDDVDLSCQSQLCVLCAHPGLDAELYYVRDDVVNHYALSFTLPVPSETNSLHFTWHSKTKVRPSARDHPSITLEALIRLELLPVVGFFTGRLPARLPHGEPSCHEPASEQHLQSGGGAPRPLWSVAIYTPRCLMKSWMRSFTATQ